LRIFPTPLSFNALARGDPFRISWWFFIKKTRVLGLSVGEDFVILACVVFTQCQRVTDRQTDRLTDGRLPTIAIAGLAATLTPCKNRQRIWQSHWVETTTALFRLHAHYFVQSLVVHNISNKVDAVNALCVAAVPSASDESMLSMSHTLYKF